jgi:hypothetical protein
MPDKPAADLKNPTFKFIGSKDDPETLICAQATYYLASIFFNEITQNGVSKPRIKEDASIYLDGFKAAAAQSYRDAADILGAEGHDALSDEMLDVAEQISFNDEKAFNHTPKNYTGKLIDFSNAWQKDLDMDLNVLALRGEQSIIDYNVSILKILPKPKWGFRP